jgi:CheY-like chemotaxis protein
MKQTLNILHIEDSKEDSELIRRLLLSNGFQCQVTRVETGPGFRRAGKKFLRSHSGGLQAARL